MKKKVKKFAMGGLGGVMGGLGGAIGGINPQQDNAAQQAVQQAGMAQQAAQQAGMSGLGGAMGRLGGMNRGSSLPNSSGMKNPGGLSSQLQAMSNVLRGRPIQSAQQAGMGGLGNAMGGMGRGSSLPNSSGMKNFGGSSPQFMGDMLLKAQQIAGEQGARATQGDPLQGLRSKTPGNLPAMGNIRNVLAQTTGAKGTLFKKGGAVKASKSVFSASKRADGIATKGKTRGKMV